MYRLDTFSPSTYLEGMDNTELRAWRKAKGMTQPIAAELLGVSLATYKRWEHGDPQQYPRLLELAVIGLAVAGDLYKPVDMASQ